MADRIKGITVVLGGDTTGLSKALSGVNKEINSTQAQLKDVEKLLKLDPGNTQLLEQKQRLLAKALENTSSKVEELKKAADSLTVDDAKYEEWKKALSNIQGQTTKTETEIAKLQKEISQFEVGTEEYDALAKKLDQCKQKYADLQKKANDTFEELGRPIGQSEYDSLIRELAAATQEEKKLKEAAEKSAKSVDKIDEKPVEDVADAADEAKSSLGKAGEAAADFGDILSANALVEGAKSIADTVSNLSDETQEFRKVMGTLEASSEKAGYAADAMNEAFYQLYWALGDDQTAATALANLQALQLKQGDLLEMIDLVTGAWATYGDSIPIDGLAESVNETIRTGTVTGTFADVLNWGAKEGETYGVMLKENTEANQEWNDAVNDAVTAEDYFNLALQDATSQQERANLVAQAMAKQGLAETSAAWYQNNKDIVNANDAQLEFMQNASELSERIAPVVNAVKEGGNQIFDTFLSLSEEIDFNAIAETINEIFDAVQSIINFVADHQAVLIGALQAIGAALVAVKIQSFISALLSVVTGVSTAAAAFPALASAIALLTNPVFLVTAAVVGLAVLINTYSEQIRAALQAVDDFLQNVFAVDWVNVFGPVLGDQLNAFMATVQNVWNGLYTALNGIINFITGVFSGSWSQAWEGIKQIFSGVFNALFGIALRPINQIIGLVNSVISSINAMIDGLNSLSINVPEGAPVLGGKTIGFDLGHLPTVPYLAKGGTVVSGSAVVGEAGPELLTVGPGGTVVTPLSGGSTTNNTTNLGGITLQVFGAPGQNVNELADVVMDRIETLVQQRSAVFGNG